jgi:hypothetical protein
MIMAQAQTFLADFNERLCRQRPSFANRKRLEELHPINIKIAPLIAAHPPMWASLACSTAVSSC